MKVCSACGNRSNRPEAKRCDQCGAELPAKPTPVSQQQPPAPITKKLQQPVDRTRKFRMPETLTKEQDLPNDLPATGRHLLIGGPGTGKSVIAMMRAGRMARAKKNHTFVAYNQLLIHYCKALSPVRINANTWIKWFKRNWQEQTGSSCPVLAKAWEIDWTSITSFLSQATPLTPPTSPYLVIDEGQDMPIEFYWALSGLGYEHIFVAADFNQVLNSGHNSNRKDLIHALEKERRTVVNADAPKAILFDPAAIIELSTNHRNPGPVARLAAYLCKQIANRQSPCPELRDDMRSADLPLLFGYDPSDTKLDLESVSRRIVLTADRNPRWLIGILCRTKAMRDTYKQALDKAMNVLRHRLDHGDPRIEIFDMSQQQEPDFSQGGIVLLTAQSCKGLEFDMVVIADIDAYWNNVADHQLLYVMVSRAIERVILLRNLTNPCPIDAILPHDPNLLSRNP